MTDIYDFEKNEQKTENYLYCFTIFHLWKGRKNKRKNEYYKNVRLDVRGLTVFDRDKEEKREFSPYYGEDYKHLVSYVPALEKILELICGQVVKAFYFENEFYEITFDYDHPKGEGILIIIKYGD